MAKKMEILIDGQKLTREQAIHEAHNHFGVGNGVQLLATELVNNRYVSVDEELYQMDKVAYMRNAIARGVYDIFLAGSVLLEYIKSHPDFFDKLISMLDTKPYSEVIGVVRHDSTAKGRLFKAIEDAENCDDLIEQIAGVLQDMIEEGNAEGSFGYSQSNTLRFSIE